MHENLEKLTDEQRKNGNIAREHSMKVRKKWAQDIADGTKTILEAVTDSTEDRKYILRTPLIDVLRAQDGWTQYTARNALLQSGFSLNDRLRSLANSQRKIDDFNSIMDSSFQRWVPNLTVPDGYPFFGKIEDILAQIDVSEFMPAQSDEDDLTQTDASETLHSDADDEDEDDLDDQLDALLGLDDDEDVDDTDDDEDDASDADDVLGQLDALLGGDD